jgi:hypothetical protein
MFRQNRQWKPEGSFCQTLFSAKTILAGVQETNLQAL